MAEFDGLPQAEKVLNNGFALSIDLNVLDHLGINLYSNLPAVLTEVVANAWDADATEVTIDLGDGEIVINDNGHGMTRLQIQERYLRVGYRRRSTPETAKSPRFDRPVMGRKGLGKLAVFSIAREVELHSVSNGEKSGLLMTEQGIRDAMTQGNGSYFPEAVSGNVIQIDIGTRITLRNLKRERLRKEELRARLARRFSVVGGENFCVKVDGKEIGEADRRELEALQFVWTIGDTPPPVRAKPVKQGSLESRLPGWADANWVVKGWFATAFEPGNLKHDADNLNAVVALARGRLFQENVLDKLNDGRLFTKYLTGYIEADFLDVDDKDDIATSDRQRVIEDDDRYRALIDYLRYATRTIVADWDTWRVEQDHEYAIKDHPALAQWLGRLRGAYRKHAERLISRIHKLTDNRDDKKVLYRHAMLGFERLRLTGGAEELEEAVEQGVDILLPLLADRDVLEACLYRDIVENRLAVIRAFEKHVDDDEREKVLQQYLFDHLWLLDPSWDRVSGSEIIERPVHTEFDKINAGLTDEEQRGRVDIKYRNTTGRHVIVELKRAKRRVTVEELVGQGRKYQLALVKCLKELRREKEPNEIIFVIGTELAEADDETYVNRQLDSVRGRVVTYRQLIERALMAYKDYLEKTRDIDQIQGIVDQL